MAAISSVAWKTAQPFPQKHALRVRPHPNPLPKEAGRFARIFVLDGSGDKTVAPTADPVRRSGPWP